MEILTKAIVLRAVDFEESDKKVQLLTEDCGVVWVKFKGIKKQNAKLKFAKEPFSFIEVSLYEKNGYFVATGATLIDMFSEIRENLDKTYSCFIILQVLQLLEVSKNRQECSQFLILALNSLKTICYDEKVNCHIVTLKFIEQFFKRCGIVFQMQQCVGCGAIVETSKPFAFSIADGGIKCDRCIESYDNAIKIETYRVIKNLVETAFENVDRLEFSGEEIRTLYKIFARLIYVNFNVKLSSIVEILKII